MIHNNLFDRYQSAESPLHRLSPVVKVLLTIFFILSNALLPDGHWLGFGISWAVILLLNIIARLGWIYTFKRSFIALPFALAAITAIFALPGKTLASFYFLSLHLVATDTGLLRFFSIIVRSWLSVQVAILLVTTTQFPDLIHALEHLRLPRLLVTVIAFLYRYIFVLSDEVLRLLRARQSRSAVLPNRQGGGTILWRAKIAGNMVGQLFLRSYERSDRVYNAMLARGYQGHLRTLNRHILHPRDRLILVIVTALLLLLQITTHFIG